MLKNTYSSYFQIVQALPNLISENLERNQFSRTFSAQIMRRASLKVVIPVSDLPNKTYLA